MDSKPSPTGGQGRRAPLALNDDASRRFAILNDAKLPAGSAGKKRISEGTLKLVLRAVHSFGAECWASLDSIAARTGQWHKQLSTRHTLRAIQALVKLDLLDRYSGRPGGTVTYRIVWQNLARHCSDDLAKQFGARPFAVPSRPATCDPGTKTGDLGSPSTCDPRHQTCDPGAQTCDPRHQTYDPRVTQEIRTMKKAAAYCDPEWDEQQQLAMDEARRKELARIFGPIGAVMTDGHLDVLDYLLAMLAATLEPAA